MPNRLFCRVLNPSSHRSSGSFRQACAELADRLRARRSEIDRAILARVYSISDPREVEDPEYQHGLYAAVVATIDYAFVSIERGEEHAPPIPLALIAQARIAARHAVEVGTALRRCAAGWAVLDVYLLEEASTDRRLAGTALKTLVCSQAALRDRLLAAIDKEHACETSSNRPSSNARALRRVTRLLSGELLETSSLAYDFGILHLGVVTEGDDMTQALRALARALDGQLFLIRPDNDTIWAWIGVRQELDRCQLDDFLTSSWPTPSLLALGEPSHGLAGWRLTHQQAKLAFRLAPHKQNHVVRYADIALPASISQDDLLSTSLRQLYLAPLAQGRSDEGKALRNTLRAYFAADRNAASAASALRISRQTVANHIKTIEKRLGCSLSTCALEIEVALRVDDLKQFF